MKKALLLSVLSLILCLVPVSAACTGDKADFAKVLLEQFANSSLSDDCSVGNVYGKYVPVADADATDLSRLKTVMERVGLDPSRFKFQQYNVFAATPFHGPNTSDEKVLAKFPDQLLIKGTFDDAEGKTHRYSGLHELRLVLRNPFITVTEIRSFSEQ